MLPQRLKIAIVVVLAVINAGLLFLVTQKMAESEVTAGEVISTPTTSTPTVTEEPEVEPGGPQGLVIAGDGSILRIFGGSCDGGEAGPGISVSSDTGGSFDDVRLPEDVRSVLSLTARNADDLDVVAASDDCEPVRYVSTDGGDFWVAEEDADEWFLDPRTKRVTSPRGRLNPGCTDNLALSAVTDRVARVFCASGVLLGTNDTGRNWARFGFLDDIRAAAFARERKGYALAPDGGCATGSYSSEDSGRTWTATGCLDAAPARAMAARGDLVAAIAGDDVYVSEDSGRNWTKAS